MWISELLGEGREGQCGGAAKGIFDLAPFPHRKRYSAQNYDVLPCKVIDALAFTHWANCFPGFFSAVRSGFGASERHCLYLEGICRRDVCKVIEDEIGACRRKWKCCRMWWVLVPIPTPIIFSDYQEPLKSKIK